MFSIGGISNDDMYNTSSNLGSGNSALSMSTSSKYFLNLPIFISAYCKECGAIVTPEIPMLVLFTCSILAAFKNLIIWFYFRFFCRSDETWKMSFGKFLEISFYNRSARCRNHNICNHTIRDNHILMFSCENYIAKFMFIPIHPYSLNIRNSVDFMAAFHLQVIHFIFNAFSFIY